MDQRRAVSGVTAQEYRRASRRRKGEILALLVHQTQLNRVYLGWLLRSWGKEVAVWANGKPIRFVVGAVRPPRARRRRRRYGRAVAEPLRKVWYLFDFMCGKRLAVVLHTNLEALVNTGELEISLDIQRKLLTISAATIDRLLAAERHKLRLKGRSLTRPGTLLKHQIPIRTFSDWQEDRPGFMEFDTVSHQGTSSYGDFALTLNGTDVATGWTESRAVRNKARRWTLEALEKIRCRLPFPLLGIDTDNGGEFINDHLVAWCRAQRITFTRSRPIRKNDSCYIEQKNWSVVRRAVGYRRHDTPREVRLLNELYDSLDPMVNFFHPSTKLKSKERVGARVVKRYDEPKTPCDRLLEHPAVNEELKSRLRARRESLNPFELKRRIVRIQQQLEAIAVAKAKAASPGRLPRQWAAGSAVTVAHPRPGEGSKDRASS